MKKLFITNLCCFLSCVILVAEVNAQWYGDEPFQISQAWALQFDSEMGRDSTTGENAVKKREAPPENAMEDMPIISEESFVKLRRARNARYIGPARKDVRTFHNW